MRNGTDKPTVIDNLLKVATENEDFSLNDVKDESNTVMMAGADTTSLTIATTLLMLSIYPEHQEKMVQEFQSILGKDADGSNVTRDDVEKMEYTEMCLKETLRLFPMVAMVVRQTTANVQLKTIDLELPPNTPIVIGVYPIHHRKEYWGENVEDFVPERFTPENEKKMHPYQYLPFMAGPRNCVGKLLVIALFLKLFNNVSIFLRSQIRYSCNENSIGKNIDEISFYNAVET